jgi:hypothetical protein
MARPTARVLQLFLLFVVFTMCATITSFTCSVVSREILTQYSTYADCGPNGSWIYKMETNKITFSDGDFDNVQAYAIGHCAYPSISGDKVSVLPHSYPPTRRWRVLLLRVIVFVGAKLR